MINFSNITKQYGNRILYRQASFQINPGEKIGLVGPNGGGKTTVFRLIVGEENADIGQVTKPDKCVIGYFSQNIEEMSGRTVLEEVLAASPFLENTKKRLAELEAQFSQELPEELMTKALVEYGDLQAEFEHRGGYSMESRASEILGGLGFSIEDQRRPVESFSGGWKMRIALAKILALRPDVLLMDEPTNHLDLESIVWLESWIAQFQGAVLMTSHDRDFMNRLVSKIVEVANQSMNVYSGNYDFYERERDLRREQLLAAARRQEEMLAKEEEFIARFAARASHAAQVQSRVKKIEKIERIEIPAEEKTIVFQWPESPRGGDDVLRIEKLSKVWELENGKKKTVFENAYAIVKRRDRVAVVGVNGAGKSTLLKV
ncbi:MAG: ABC-F family ATP-binding cassette domain-containing protein, partial [Bdellovibrio sp.]